MLLSRTPAGGLPNGPSGQAAISGDRQLASLTAFASYASDLVPGDANGTLDVFAVRRADPLADGLRGLPWRAAGPAALVSRGMGGAPANGPSYGPDLDGDQIHDGLDAANRPQGRDGPHCVAFVSAASNLVPGDTNNRPDGFRRRPAHGPHRAGDRRLARAPGARRRPTTSRSTARAGASPSPRTRPASP